MTDLHTLLGRLAVPRLVGSQNHARVRELLREELRRRGFVVMEHRFAAAADRLAAVAWAGGFTMMGGFAAAGLALTGEAPRRVAGWVLICLGLALVILLPALRSGLGRAARLLPREGVTLIGARPGARVAVWLAAHYDSKGQPLSMAGRIFAALRAILATLGLVAAAVWALTGEFVSTLEWVGLGTPAMLGGFLLTRTMPLGDSPGAVDNATGLLTVLEVLDALPRESSVGVLFLDAEEFGLEGARALVRERANLLQGTAVVNFDGIDDAGRPLVMAHRPGPVVAKVAQALGVQPVRFRPVLVDGQVLARGARECVTILRGDLDTARVVHTSRDAPGRLTLAGVAEVAGAVARALR